MTSRAQVTLELRQAAAWWIGELKTMAYQGLEKLPLHRKPAFDATVSEAAIQIWSAGSNRDEAPLLASPLESFEAMLGESTSEDLKPWRERQARVRIQLEPRWAYMTSFELPLAAVPHLKSAIALQLPKLLPMAADQLWMDYEVRERRTDSIRVELAAVRRSDIERITAPVRESGADVVSIGVSNGLESRFELNRLCQQPNRSFRRLDKIALGVAACLALVCVSIAAVQAYRSQAALAAAEQAVAEPARLAMKHRQELEEKLKPLFALQAEAKVPPAATLLSDLTRALPQGAYLTTFELKDRHLHLVGVGTDTEAIVRLLNGVPTLKGVRLISSMSAGIGTGKDRFEVNAEVASL